MDILLVYLCHLGCKAHHTACFKPQIQTRLKLHHFLIRINVPFSTLHPLTFPYLLLCPSYYLFCPYFLEINRVQLVPKIKTSFKEERRRRRDSIKMMKTFNFYLGILVRTRVYTNTDCNGFACVCFNFFFTFSFTLI